MSLKSCTIILNNLEKDMIEPTLTNPFIFALLLSHQENPDLINFIDDEFNESIDTHLLESGHDFLLREKCCLTNKTLTAYLKTHNITGLKRAMLCSSENSVDFFLRLQDQLGCSIHSEKITSGLSVILALKPDDEEILQEHIEELMSK